MSPLLRNIFPGLRLREPKRRELQGYVLDDVDGESEDGDDQGNAPDRYLVGRYPIFYRRRLGAMLFLDMFYRPVPRFLLPAPPPRCFDFHQLPPSLMRKIFEYVFVEEGRSIHALSRLDPCFPPSEMPERGHGLLHRFHVGNSSCNITFAKKPNDVLGPLLVCKAWLFLGIHAFYGKNTFAFSSLGEFGRFCEGIGMVRLQRLQSVELLWIGSQALTKPQASLRTWAVSYLCETVRLKYLGVFLNETNAAYIGRKWEDTEVKKYLADHTAGKPNYRMTRSLRTLQGLDYIHQLRGMKRVQFFDFDAFLEDHVRAPVRDWTFTRDVNMVATQRKRHPAG